MISYEGVHALLVGINYVRSPHLRLQGCVNDALNMRKFLVRRLGVPRGQVHVATDTNPLTLGDTTRDGFLRALTHLMQRTHEDASMELVWVHFSGHGTYKWQSRRRTNPERREDDRRDECLVPSDHAATGALIRDDELHDVLALAHPRVRIMFVADCCHSGTVCDLKWQFRLNPDDSVSKEPTHCMTALPAKVLMLSGCRDDQTSADAYNVQGREQFSGAMTSCFLLALFSEGEEKIVCEEQQPGRSLGSDGPPPSRCKCRGQRHTKALQWPDVFAVLRTMRRELHDRGYSQTPQLTASYDLCSEGEFLALRA